MWRVNSEALVELEMYWNQLVSNGDQMRCGERGARKKMQIFGAYIRSQLRIDVLKMRQTWSGRKGLGDLQKGVLHSECLLACLPCVFVAICFVADVIPAGLSRACQSMLRTS